MKNSRDENVESRILLESWRGEAEISYFLSSAAFFSRRSGAQAPAIQVETPMRGRMTAWSRIQMPTPSNKKRFSMGFLLQL